MGKAKWQLKWLFMDVRDDQVTEVYAYVEAAGDAPLTVQGCHHKTFPARTALTEILEQHVGEIPLWPLDAPPFTFDSRSK
jgi:hypothetical protein